MHKPTDILSEYHLKELKESYDLFDLDKSGLISISELGKICQILDITADDNEIKNLMKLMDKDNSGQIDFIEFSNVMAQYFYRPPIRKELETAFDYFDKDKSGYISVEELYQVMSKFKGTVTKNDVSRIIKNSDSDRDSRISKTEFVNMILSHTKS